MGFGCLSLPFPGRCVGLHGFLRRTPHLPSAPHRYVDRVTELLQQKLKQSQLLALKKELMVQKQQEALREQAALEPKLDLLLEKTRELQKLVRRGRQACRGGGRDPTPSLQNEAPLRLCFPPTGCHCLSD